MAEPLSICVSGALGGVGRALVEGIDQLSDTLRTTLILVCMDGLSHAEAGEALGCPEGTIAWRVHEARKKLRGMLSERGFDDDAP